MKKEVLQFGARGRPGKPYQDSGIIGQQFHSYVGGAEPSVWGVKYRMFDPSDFTQPVRRLVVPKRHG